MTIGILIHTHLLEALRGSSYCHKHSVNLIGILLHSANTSSTMTVHGVSSIPGESDVRFSLRGITYQNNSLVTLEDIGEGYDALLCLTDLTACCRPPYTWGSKGNWFFPNETRVPSSSFQWNFHRTRGQMVVRLYRRRGGENGIYRCVIPDTTDVNQSIYIGVYTANMGEESTYSN